MKKFAIIVLMSVASAILLSGCATRTGTALLAGGAGVLVGSAIANAHAQPRTVVVQERSAVVIVAEQCQYYPHYTAERAACERGARQRYYEELRRRENEAYRTGLGR
jgi:ABC-type Fe3+-hydroxamate transport system substrate-binding protein